MLPILYSFRRCPYAMRARMAIILSSVECELREVLLKNKPQAMLKISPKGTVPVLQLQNRILDESMDIIDWALHQNSSRVHACSEHQSTLSNDWIARDEGMHFSFSALMFKTLRDKYNNNTLTNSDISDLSLIPNDVPQSQFEEIVREAVSFEKEFVKDALPVDLIGMNEDLMCQYIEAVADRIADLFEFDRVFNTENPFDFMRALDVQNVTNFFEKRVSEYQRPTDRALSFDDAF